MSSTRLQLLSAWAGPVFLVFYAIAFWGIAGFIPPPDPILSAEELAAFYDESRAEIRIGQLGGLIASTLLFPFFVVISMQIARIERSRGGSPLLATIQFGGAALLIIFFQLCAMLWIAATFRAELEPSTIRALHDTSWLIFVMVFPAYVLQMVCMAIAGFIDQSPRPTWPRWAAYFNLWVGFAGAGGGLAVFFKEGPFAWNGLIGFWIPVVVFAIWLVLTTWLLHGSIKREAEAEGDDVEVRKPELALGVGAG